jgi:hypothetical protein
MMVRWVSTIAVLAHFVVGFFHGGAHSSLRVELNAWQRVYVIAVITIAPLIAMLLVWTRYVRAGLVLLALSMLGSLIFGIYFHYIFISPDHVSHLPPGDAQGMFRATALLLVLTELFGVIAGLWGLRRLSSTAGVRQRI